MPLADKIIELRKKQGWSQIDLADRLDVSRQSVSKWEMAQAVPELDKIIKMSELFAVTTDYLLKDNAPGPEQTGGTPPSPPETPPAPDPEQSPEPEALPPAATPEKSRHKKRLWALAAVAVAAAVIGAAVWAFSGQGEPEQIAISTPIPLPSSTPPPLSAEQAQIARSTPIPLVDPSPTPPPLPADGTAEEPVTEEAVSGPDAAESPMTVYAFEGDAMTAGGVDPAELEAMAAEYAPYGVTCEYDEDHCQWYLDGEPIRTFTDVLYSNGESLTSGHFHGVLRNYAGEGDIDVRTVRDFDNCDALGVGELLYMESRPAHGDAIWTEHHAGEHHDEDRHE